MRTWAANGLTSDLAALLADAEALAAGGPIFDVDDPTFTAPGDMPTRIAAAIAARGDAVPSSPPEMVRAVVDSLASAYAKTIAEAEALSARDVETVHIVGGGSQNALLCRLTAQLAARPVVAGPVEATALGNVLVQARTHGALPPSLDELRAHVASTTPLRRYESNSTRPAR